MTERLMNVQIQGEFLIVNFGRLERRMLQLPISRNLIWFDRIQTFPTWRVRNDAWSIRRFVLRRMFHVGISDAIRIGQTLHRVHRGVL